MTVSSQDFISFAKDCITRNDDIGFRNAVGRAYYGAYHHVNGLMTNGPRSSHQGLIDYLKKSSWRENNEAYDKKYLVALSYALQSLKDQRVIADYELSANFVEMDANISVVTAEKLIEKCTDMLREKAS